MSSARSSSVSAGSPKPVSIAAGAWGAMSDSEDPSSSSVSVSVDFNAGVSRSTGALKISDESEGKDDGFGVDGVTSGDDCCSGVGDGVGGIGDGVGGGVGGGGAGGAAGGGGGGDGSLDLFKGTTSASWFKDSDNAVSFTLQMNFCRSVQNVSSQWPRKGLDTSNTLQSAVCPNVQYLWSVQ